MIEQIKDNFPDEQFVIADGFNNAIIGLDVIERRIIYSVTKVLDILIKEHNLSSEDAYEYFEYNIFNAYFGERTPIWSFEY
jgi:hypothetical protein